MRILEGLGIVGDLHDEEDGVPGDRVGHIGGISGTSTTPAMRMPPRSVNLAARLTFNGIIGYVCTATWLQTVLEDMHLSH